LIFGNGKCIVKGPDGQKVGEIPKDRKGLYRVEHEPDSANAVIETLTLDQLHHHMGHISPGTAQNLVENKFVTGL
jgi:hypothetical protein